MHNNHCKWWCYRPTGCVATSDILPSSGIHWSLQYNNRVIKCITWFYSVLSEWLFIFNKIILLIFKILCWPSIKFYLLLLKNEDKRRKGKLQLTKKKKRNNNIHLSSLSLYSYPHFVEGINNIKKFGKSVYLWAFLNCHNAVTQCRPPLGNHWMCQAWRMATRPRCTICHFTLFINIAY